LTPCVGDNVFHQALQWFRQFALVHALVLLVAEYKDHSCREVCGCLADFLPPPMPQLPQAADVIATVHEANQVRGFVEPSGDGRVPFLASGVPDVELDLEGVGVLDGDDARSMVNTNGDGVFLGDGSLGVLQPCYKTGFANTRFAYDGSFYGYVIHVSTLSLTMVSPKFPNVGSA
jgi:hypothetical protein